MEQRESIDLKAPIVEFEPPIQAMIRGWEPLDRPITSYEVFCICGAFVFWLIALVSHWQILLLLTLLLDTALLLLLVVRLCLPLRFSLTRFVFAITVLSLLLNLLNHF